MDINIANESNDDIELELLLQAIHRKYGYDFSEYSRAHVKRRVLNRLTTSGLTSISHLQEQVLYDKEFASQLLKDLSINVTEMFRDPPFYIAVREKVIELLKTWSYIKIWHAGCSTGEEVYSMAILLKEEGLYDRVQIYATDFNQSALSKARDGIFSTDLIKKYSQNYIKAASKGAFSDYYLAQYDHAIMDQSLKSNIVWAHHNLVTDNNFAETQMVVCRNVLIYFNRRLQNNVLRLFYESLTFGGILCLGNKEGLHFSDYEQSFDVIDKQQKIYKKKYLIS
ncbi:protein-glutamate O-methyltransferase CheR [Fulvivirga ulvae]|uniref:CheR family methyltransferase n=1 Tax=Fulvivirga ulvae TaxID=2904245 RepID=UPI001F1E9175|nr:protein-glutamate O-methyltransferase CheR [Fulvivirga ulvae]UII31015.1 protein-glutamate O-methyltransferase CheR [Fulvivirga ulvae]